MDGEEAGRCGSGRGGELTAIGACPGGMAWSPAP